MAKIIALKNFVANGQIFEKGKEYDVADVSSIVWAKNGWAREVGSSMVESEIISVGEGLPPLDETPSTPARKRK